MVRSWVAIALPAAQVAPSRAPTAAAGTATAMSAGSAKAASAAASPVPTYATYEQHRALLLLLTRLAPHHHRSLAKARFVRLLLSTAAADASSSLWTPFQVEELRLQALESLAVVRRLGSPRPHSWTNLFCSVRADEFCLLGGSSHCTGAYGVSDALGDPRGALRDAGAGTAGLCGPRLAAPRHDRQQGVYCPRVIDAAPRHGGLFAGGPGFSRCRVCRPGSRGTPRAPPGGCRRPRARGRS
jgi:hypothetical protein